MIVARLKDATLRKALVAAAHPEEDVVWQPAVWDDALLFGHPRLIVRADGYEDQAASERVPVLDLDEALLKRWETAWRASPVPGTWLRFVTEQLRLYVEPRPEGPSWVDAALADLSRAAGARLPLALRAFGRRVLEFPMRYTSLQPVTHACGLSRGALRAKFRRRGLSSPSTYLRWFRMMAVAEALSDRSVTVSTAAHRLGFTSAGNMCRTMAALTRLTPTEARTLRGWNTLLLSFAWVHLTPEALAAWAGLEELFERRVA